MSKPLLPKRTTSPALRAGLYYARKNRRIRLDLQIKNHITYSASPVNPDASKGISKGDGTNT